jgi:hypothetical protein
MKRARPTTIRRSNSRSALFAALTLIALSACATGPAAPDVVDAPDSFTDRAPLESCGVIVLELGDGDGRIPGEELQCMSDAAAGDGAELTVTSSTMEGDDIVTYYRVGPGIPSFEMFVDTTRDRYGSKEWTYQSCQEDDVLTGFAICAL